MSVYNSSNQLEESIDSILQQSHDDFELIIINDGSTDNSQQILQSIAATDKRIKLFQQSNKGLTASLIFGCNQASADYIARHDVGDRSATDRFKKQWHYLNAHRDCAAVFTQFQSIDDQGTVIFKFCPTVKTVESSINIDNEDISTPSHHGSVMFSKKHYQNSGGYRQQFHFTQDLDLWIRMSEHGTIHLIEEILYDALIGTDTISGKYHPLQKQYHDIIIESAKLRRSGQSESNALSKASRIKPTTSTLQLNNNASGTLYFMASCLVSENPAMAKRYLKQAIRKNPMHLKAWYKLIFKT